MAQVGCRSVTKPGDIVAPVSWDDLALFHINSAANAEILPLRPDLTAALRWRLANLVPIATGRAYEPIWFNNRSIMLAAVYQSGDYHYGTPESGRRQALARWVHARLVKEDAIA